MFRGNGGQNFCQLRPGRDVGRICGDAPEPGQLPHGQIHAVPVGSLERRRLLHQTGNVLLAGERPGLVQPGNGAVCAVVVQHLIQGAQQGCGFRNAAAVQGNGTSRIHRPDRLCLRLLCGRCARRQQQGQSGKNFFPANHKNIFLFFGEYDIIKVYLLPLPAKQHPPKRRRYGNTAQKTDAVFVRCCPQPIL